MTSNPYLNIMFEPCNFVERLGHFNGMCIRTKPNGIHGGKYILKTPGNAIFETLNFKMSLDASALKNLWLWYKFKAAFYSLSTCYLKTFWQPWPIIIILSVTCNSHLFYSITWQKCLRLYMHTISCILYFSLVLLSKLKSYSSFFDCVIILDAFQTLHNYLGYYYNNWKLCLKS